MKHLKRGALAVLAVLAILLVWLLWPDRKLAQARALRTEMSSEAAKAWTPEQKREKWEQMRTIQKSLSSSQREALSADSRKRRTAELARYAKMTPAEKTRHLDEQINRMEQARKQKGASPGKGTFAVSTGGQPKTGSKSTPQGRDQNRQRFLDSSSPAERALFNQYRRDMDARRAQRGLGPMGGGPRR